MQNKKKKNSKNNHYFNIIINYLSLIFYFQSCTLNLNNDRLQTSLFSLLSPVVTDSIPSVTTPF